MEKKRISVNWPAVCLALTVVLLTVLGPLLCSVAMVITKTVLPEIVIFSFRAVSVVLAGLTLMLYFCYYKEPQGQKGHVQRVLPMLKAELWLLAVFLLWRTAWYILFDMAPAKLIENAALIRTLAPVWIMVGLLFAVIMFHWMVHISWQSNKKTGFFASLLHLFRHPLILVLSLLCCVLLVFVYILMGILGSLLGKGDSFLSMIAAYLLKSVGCYFVLMLLFWLFRRAEQKDAKKAPVQTKRDDTEQPDEAVYRKKPAGILISCVVAAVIIVAAGLYQNGDRLFVSGNDRVFSSVETTLSEADMKVLEGSFDAAVVQVNKAAAQLQALDTYVNENSEYSIGTLQQENTDDPLIGFLYLLETGDFQELEQKARTGALDESWYPVLLNYMKTLEELTPNQKTLQRELVQICIAREIFTSDMPDVRDLTKGKLAVRKEMEKYQEYLQLYNGLELATAYGKSGGVTRELVEQVLELAEENPENASLQYMAVMIGSNYQADNANHYGRTMEAASRFDKLYTEAAGQFGKLSVDDVGDDASLAREKAALGQAALRCYEYEIAKDYLDQAYALESEAVYALMSARCSEKLGDYETCYDMAGEAAKEDETDDEALYLMCISALKMQNTDAALEAAMQLSDLVENDQAEDLMSADQRLYVCAQYMAMKDSASWTDYTYCIYDQLNDTQLGELKKHAVLQGYMTAIYQCFMKKDYETALTAADGLLKVRDDLHYAWYLKGTILSNQKQFEAALEAYKKAEAINSGVPATLFSIANTYDALGDYETAYLYCQRIAVLMPDVDHGSDMFGIIYHNQRLMEALERELNQ